MDLPHFRYHPDPIATGSIKKSDRKCLVCGQARGYIYYGAIYIEGREYGECICPWCIADGSAHEKLGVEFNDYYAIGTYGNTIPRAVIEEVAYRTPGFSSWQPKEWPSHCDDAAAFLGRVGYAELVEYGEAAFEAIIYPEELMETLDKDGSPTGYLFQCRHCGRYLGDTDCD